MDMAIILSRKLITLFPEEAVRNNAQSILDSYGVESYEQEPVRVRLAILKLSGSDVEELRIMTKYAKEDFRDILTWPNTQGKAKDGLCLMVQRMKS